MSAPRGVAAAPPPAAVAGTALLDFEPLDAGVARIAPVPPAPDPPPEDLLTDAERRVLAAHERHPAATRGELQRLTGLPKNTVNTIVQRLGLPVRQAKGARDQAAESAADIVNRAKQRTENLRDTMREGVREEAERVTRVFGLDDLSREPLNKREADDAQPILTALVRVAGQHLDDDLLARTNRAHVQPTIWSWDEEEATQVVELWLSFGRKSGPAAYSVRVALVAHDLWKGGYIVARSLVQTVLFYLQNGGFGW